MRSFTLFGLAVFALAGYALASNAKHLPDDQPVEVNGVRLACTGIGDDAQHDPRWKAYPVRIEFANAAREYLSGVELAVADASGKQLFKVSCDSPWVLAALAAGKYQLTASYEGFTATAKFSPPKSGQKRVVVRFPEVR